MIHTPSDPDYLDQMPSSPTTRPVMQFLRTVPACRACGGSGERRVSGTPGVGCGTWTFSGPCLWCRGSGKQQANDQSPGCGPEGE